MYDLIIVGGGPAGLTAAVYAIRKRLNVLLVSKDLGGKTNYRLALPWVEDPQVIRGLEIVNKFRNELEYLDFARYMEAVEKVAKEGDLFTITTRGGASLETRAVIIASGAQQARLDVPGEKEFTMKGLCYSVTSFAPVCLDKNVVLIGNREMGIRSARELATIARQVYFVCKDDAFLRQPMGRELSSAANMILLKNHRVVEIKGDAYARSIVLEKPAGGNTEIETDAIFVEQALTPSSQMVAGLVKLDESKHIMVDCACRTNVPGLFAAGDVTNGYAEQVLIAAGEGAKAALSAYEYLLSTY